jgi:heme-degrading monooxygenase HmoA
MICRIWHGWTTRENADRYEAIVSREVIPGILAMRIPGFEKIELYRRSREDDVEFVTVMWFHNLEAVKAFMGEDYEAAHVPQRAREVLARFDARSQHYDILLSKDATAPD